MDFSPGHLDLLLSRLFHDLISPVGAARNGLELLKEFGADEVGVDAMDLAADSTEQATARLTYFRMAFGGAGSSAGHGFSEADRIVRGYLASRRIEWTFSGVAGSPTPQTGAVKVLLGAVAVLADAMPRLGGISAMVREGSVILAADGEGAVIEPEVLQALNGDREASDERTVLAATVSANVRRFGLKLTVDAVSPPTISIVHTESS